MEANMNKLEEMLDIYLKVKLDLIDGLTDFWAGHRRKKALKILESVWMDGWNHGQRGDYEDEI
jgi:hypothetical protein